MARRRPSATSALMSAVRG